MSGKKHQFSPMSEIHLCHPMLSDLPRLRQRAIKLDIFLYR